MTRQEARKRVAGVDVSKVDEAVLNECLRAFELDASGSIEQRVTKMVGYVRRTTPEVDFAECDTCGGESDVKRIRVCPYCGDGELADGEAMVTLPPKSERPPKPAPAPEPQEAKLVLFKKKAAPREEPVDAKLVEAGGQTSDLPSDFEGALALAHDLKRQGMVSAWELGRALTHIWEGKLFLERRDDAGRPVFATWTQFVVREIGMTPQHSYRLMLVASHFDRADVETVGVKKLGLLFNLPKEEQKLLLQRARSGASTSTLAEEIRRLAGVPDAGEDEYSLADIKSPPGKNKGKDQRLTVALMLGQQKLPLFKRIKARGTADRSRVEPQQAARLADDPEAELELTNGVVMHFRVVSNRKGKLELLIDVRR